MSRYGSASVARSFVLGEGFRDQVAGMLPARVAASVDWQGTCETVGVQLDAAVTAGQVGAVEGAHARAVLGVAAREWVTGATGDTLAGLGFAVQIDTGPVAAVRAERGDTVVAVEVGEGGGFAFDVAGIEDDRCQTLVDEVIDGLEARGVSSEVTLHAHNDPRGGQLLRRVHSRTRGRAGRGRAGRIAG